MGSEWANSIERLKRADEAFIAARVAWGYRIGPAGALAWAAMMKAKSEADAALAENTRLWLALFVGHNHP